MKQRNTSRVNHGGGSIMVSACMAANGTSSLLLTDDVSGDRSSTVNSELHRSIISAHIQPNTAKRIAPLLSGEG